MLLAAVSSKKQQTRQQVASGKWQVQLNCLTDSVIRQCDKVIKIAHSGATICDVLHAADPSPFPTCVRSYHWELLLLKPFPIFHFTDCLINHSAAAPIYSSCPKVFGFSHVLVVVVVVVSFAHLAHALKICFSVICAS